MDKFSQLFYQYTEGECDYLRIKNVELAESTMTANIHVYVREDKYDNFDNKVIKQLDKFFKAIVKQYTIKFFFERLVVSEAVVREELVQYLLVTYPFVASNLRTETIVVEVEEDVVTTLFLPERVMEYAKHNVFQKQVEDYLSDRFMTSAKVCLELTDDVVEESEIAKAPILSNRVRVADAHYLAGTKSPEPSSATLLETVKDPQESIFVMGKVSNFEMKKFDAQRPEDAAKKRTFFPFRYTFGLDDTTGKIRVTFNSKLEVDALKTPPEFLVVRGRVFYSEGRGEYAVYAKTLYTGKVDFDVLAESRKPLPPPAEYRVEPKPASVKVQVRQLRLDEEEPPQKTIPGTVVFAYVKSVSKTNLSPYEMSFIKVKDGVPVSHYTTYVYLRDVLGIDARFKSYVSTAPRLGDITPDLVKYLHHELVVAVDAPSLQNLLLSTAKTLRYQLDCEFWDAAQLGKKGKEKLSLDKMFSAHHIVLDDDTAYEYAYGLYRLYLEMKGV